MKYNTPFDSLQYLLFFYIICFFYYHYIFILQHTEVLPLMPFDPRSLTNIKFVLMSSLLYKSYGFMQSSIWRANRSMFLFDIFFVHLSKTLVLIGCLRKLKYVIKRESCSVVLRSIPFQKHYWIFPKLLTHTDCSIMLKVITRDFPWWVLWV